MAKLGKARKYYVVDQVQKGQWVQIGYFAFAQRAHAFADFYGGRTRVKLTYPSGKSFPGVRHRVKGEI